jgi:hypothetical protein
MYKIAVIKLCSLLCCGGIIWGFSSLAIATQHRTPQIGILQGVPEPVYDPTVGPSCTYYLHLKSSNLTEWKPIFDHQKPDSPVMNIGGKNITLKLIRRKYARPIMASYEELRQEIFAYRKLRITVNYKVIDSNYEGVTYEAAIAAKLKGITRRVNARGFYGCPRTP